MSREKFIEQMHNSIEGTLDRFKIICPMPDEWSKFYHLGLSWIEDTVTKEDLLEFFGRPALLKASRELPDFYKHPVFLSEFEKWFPRSLVFAGWYASSDPSRRETFVKQLKFLREHRLLDKGCLYLLTIPKNRWHRYGDRRIRLGYRNRE